MQPLALVLTNAARCGTRRTHGSHLHSPSLVQALLPLRCQSSNSKESTKIEGIVVLQSELSKKVAGTFRVAEVVQLRPELISLPASGFKVERHAVQTMSEI